MTVPTISLNSGYDIPQLGFGVFQIPPEETKEATATALEVGYRHIDTAEMYGNEAGVGEAIRASGIDRSELFVTSKLNNKFLDADSIRAAFDGTIAALDIDYLDLFLIHWPLPTISDYVERWKAMEGLLETGKVRSIGVSNFQVPHLEKLLEATEVVPAVNQIEVHPYLTNDAVRAFDQEHGIATEAWSPIAQGKVLDNPVITGIAERVSKSPAQVVLRWHIQRGEIVFPKSTHRERMEENFALFDFELTEDDVKALSALNRDERTGANPDTMAWVPKD
jgi:2,5-diketo-D-gluconate reductase A